MPKNKKQNRQREKRKNIKLGRKGEEEDMGGVGDRKIKINILHEILKG